MRTTVGALATLLLFATLSCGDSGRMGGEGLSYNVLFEGTDASWIEHVHLIVRSDEHWQSVWGTIRSGAPPPVDFGSDVVVVIALGVRPQLCHKVEVRDVVERRGRVEIDAVEVSGHRCFCINTLSYPLVVLSINRPDSPIDIDLGLVDWPGCDEPTDSGV